MKQLIFTLLLTISLMYGQSQNCRFLDEVFPTYQRTDGIVYGTNATILYFPVTGEAIPEDLVLDVYEPVGDTSTKRPLIIYFHSGNFLPYPLNQSPVGTRQDSASVEFCKRLAKAGFVVASADYRLGWNALTTNPTEGTIGIINAAYRSVQDANTCIRYFKKTFVEEGNPFRIDTCRIVLFGDDTGGYLSVHAGALDRYSKILESPQFIIPIGGGQFLPMVVEHLNGDPEGKQYGINDPPVPIFPFPVGDTLNYPNHVEYSSRFCAAVNIGGAVAEAAWIEPGQPPIISVGTQYDQTTPYGCGIVYLNGNPIINVCGPHGITTQSYAVGNLSNSIISPVEYCSALQEDVTTVSLTRNDGLDGLFSVIGNSLTDYNPWIFCEPNEMNCQNYISTNNAEMSRENASLYIDTILAYVMPRLFTVLNLSNPEEFCTLTKVDVINGEEREINLFPNPVSEKLVITTGEKFTIKEIVVSDAMGRNVFFSQRINDTSFELSVGHLASGMYTVQILFDDGIAARQIVVK